MVTDVRCVEGTFVPVFSADQRLARIKDAVEAQRCSFMSAVAIAEKHGLRETLSLDDASLNVLALALYQALSNQKQLEAVYAAQHFAEDMSTLKQLGCI
jgi:hypothetical protein